MEPFGQPRHVLHRNQSVNLLRLFGFFVVTSGVAATFLCSGCASSRTEPGFAKNPQKHRRVAVAAISFNGSISTNSLLLSFLADTNRSLLANDLLAFNRAAGRDLRNAVTNVLAHKGFEIVASSNLVCGEADMALLTHEARSVIQCLHRELFAIDNATNAVTAGTTAATNQTKSAQMKQGFPIHVQTDLNPLGVSLSDPDAVLVMDSSFVDSFESKMQKRNRIIWNSTMGPVWVVADLALISALIAFGGSNAGDAVGPVAMIGLAGIAIPDNSIRHSAALIDMRSREVLWINARSVSGYSVTKPHGINASVEEALADVPRIKSRR
jgi:hypothetical protein